jgi:cytochrome c oxidase subunit 4
MNAKPPSTGAHLLALATLGFLLATSVFVAHFHLGAFNTFAGPAIAVLKAMVILFFFMKLGTSGAPIRFAACFGFVWLLILITLTMGDYLTRMPLGIR